MTWDDSGNTWLHGTGPTLTVKDADGNPNNILQKNLANACTVSWSFNGSGTWFLDLTTFTVDLYAESIGPGPEVKVGSTSVPGSAHTPPGFVPPPWSYTATISIPPNSLNAEGEGTPPASGVYKLTAVISNSIAGHRDQLAGFIEGPVIEIRNP